MQKILSSKPNSQTLRRSADRRTDHALRPIFLKGATIMDAIIYTTNTGSTGQYAKLLAQETGLPAYSLAEAKKRVFAGAEVVYLGWIMAGSVKGCEALSGVRCLRRRHGTNRNADRQRAEKVRNSSQHSAVHPARKLQC